MIGYLFFNLCGWPVGEGCKLNCRGHVRKGEVQTTDAGIDVLLSTCIFN